MTGLEIVVAALIVVGLLGTIVPVLPGVLLIWGAILLWAWQTSGGTAWTVFAVVTALLVVGQAVKYLVPGKRMSNQGIPSSTLWIGGLVAIVGFFVIPVVGIFIGFAVGIYLAEWRRLGSHDEARPATLAALRAVGLSILIELAAGVAAFIAWGIGVAAT